MCADSIRIDGVGFFAVGRVCVSALLSLASKREVSSKRSKLVRHSTMVCTPTWAEQARMDARSEAKNPSSPMTLQKLKLYPLDLAEALAVSRSFSAKIFASPVKSSLLPLAPCCKAFLAGPAVKRLHYSKVRLHAAGDGGCPMFYVHTDNTPPGHTPLAAEARGLDPAPTAPPPRPTARPPSLTSTHAMLTRHRFWRCVMLFLAQFDCLLNRNTERI